MKQLARKPRPVSLVPPASEETKLRIVDNREETGEDSRGSLRDFFDGWLNSVSPRILQSPNGKVEPTRSFRGHTSFTATDLIRVERATVRESRAHRRWPPEVIETFLAAEVIRRQL
ncbi:MAG: hypothetical protein M3R69_02585 [Acidobacteriota bacterium]|nr:hypothetical protein [Acidobacteriota bacterium]